MELNIVNTYFVW